MTLPDYFGSEDQQALLRRGAAMHQITRALPCHTYYGRAVGVVANDAAPLETATALARLQGNGSIADVPDVDIPALQALVEAEGLVPTHYARWEGGPDALKAAQGYCDRSSALPQGYTLTWLTPDSPAKLRQSLAKMALACGVLPPALHVLCGATQPGACAMALTDTGEVAACAGAASYLSESHLDRSKTCWWGMLAADPNHRGRALSLILGARVIIEMQNRYGFTRFFTGVVPGNRPSEVICTKMGLVHEGRSILAMADPNLLAGGKMTK